MILAFCGQKGGVGKSTTAIAVACELERRGRRVLLVDGDPQGTARTWGEVATEAGESTVTVVAMGENMHKPGQLDRVASGFDVTVIDCPPRHGAIQRAALMVSDVAILPCGPSAADAWALASSVELVNEATALRPELRATIVITRKQGRTALGKGARQVMEQAGLPVLGAELCYRVAYQEAIAAGKGPTTYAPKDQAAVEVRKLVDELATLARHVSRSMPRLKTVPRLKAVSGGR